MSQIPEPLSERQIAESFDWTWQIDIDRPDLPTRSLHALGVQEVHDTLAREGIHVTPVELARLVLHEGVDVGGVWVSLIETGAVPRRQS